MREADVEKYFNKQAKLNNAETRKIKFLDRRGAPDRLILFDAGELYWVELKRPNKKAEAHQKREHARFKKRGQNVLVLDTLEKIDKFFTLREVM